MPRDMRKHPMKEHNAAISAETTDWTVTTVGFRRVHKEPRGTKDTDCIWR
jgi:hypothetical protein